MWHCGSPRIHIQFRVLGEAGRHSRIQTVSTGLPVNCAISSFYLTRHHTKTWTTHPRGTAEEHALRRPRARRAAETRTL